MKEEQSAANFRVPQIAVVNPLHDHEEGHTEWVDVEQSADDYGDL